MQIEGGVEGQMWMRMSECHWVVVILGWMVGSAGYRNDSWLFVAGGSGAFCEGVVEDGGKDWGLSGWQSHLCGCCTGHMLLVFWFVFLNDLTSCRVIANVYVSLAKCFSYSSPRWAVAAVTCNIKPRVEDMKLISKRISIIIYSGGLAL